MNRVVIIGNMGGGKTTLANQIAEMLGIPITPLDKLLWQDDGLPKPREEFNRDHAALIAQDRWIIDGIGPRESIKTRFEAADVIVFIDQPL